jgi:hypothetical protein
MVSEYEEVAMWNNLWYKIFDLIVNHEKIPISYYDIERMYDQCFLYLREYFGYTQG